MSTYHDKVLVKTEVLGRKIDRIKAPFVVWANVWRGASFFDGYLYTVSDLYFINTLDVHNVTTAYIITDI